MPPTTRSRQATLTAKPSSPIPHQNALDAGIPPQLPIVPSTSIFSSYYRIPKKKNFVSTSNNPAQTKHDDVVILENINSASNHGASQVFQMANSLWPLNRERFSQPPVANIMPRPGLPHPRLSAQNIRKTPITSVTSSYRPIKAKPVIPTSPSPVIGTSDTVDLFLSNPTQHNSPGGATTLVKLSLRSTGGKSWKVVQSTAVPVTSVAPRITNKNGVGIKNDTPPTRQRFKSVVTPKRRQPSCKQDSKTQAAKRSRITTTNASSSGSSTDADNSSMSTSTADDSRRADSEISESRDGDRSPSPTSSPIPVPSGIGPNFTSVQKEAMADHFRNDDKSAERYTALKEWAMLETTKLFNNGNLRNQLRSILTSHLDLVEGDHLSVKDVDAARTLIKSRSAEFQLDGFKRQLCQQIIRLRDPNYSVYRQNSSTQDSTGSCSNLIETKSDPSSAS